VTTNVASSKCIPVDKSLIMTPTKRCHDLWQPPKQIVLCNPPIKRARLEYVPKRPAVSISHDQIEMRFSLKGAEKLGSPARIILPGTKQDISLHLRAALLDVCQRNVIASEYGRVHRVSCTRIVSLKISEYISSYRVCTSPHQPITISAIQAVPVLRRTTEDWPNSSVPTRTRSLWVKRRASTSLVLAVTY
jgi:hypothetical protein